MSGATCTATFQGIRCRRPVHKGMPHRSGWIGSGADRYRIEWEDDE